MTKIFSISLLIISILTTIHVNAQSIKDYYMPNIAENNKALFIEYFNRKKSDVLSEYRYYDNKDGTFDTQYVYGIINGDPAGVIIETIEFGEKEVRQLQSRTLSILHKDIKPLTVFDPPLILLKMPLIGQTETWTIFEVKHTSSWSTLNLDGKNIKCIKRISQNTSSKDNSGNILISYYAEGFGIIKHQTFNKFGELLNESIFDSLSYKETDEEKEKRKIKITSKTYNLNQYKESYNEALFNQRKVLIDFFMENSRRVKFISFQELENSPIKYERFKNIYSVTYESLLKNDYNPRGLDNSSLYSGGNTNQYNKNIKVELIEGTDEKGVLFKYTSINPPILVIEGFQVNTISKFNNIKIDFTRGITEIKIRNKNVSFKKFEPEKDLQPILIDELKDKPSGKYKVKYEIGTILDYEVKNIKVIK